MDEKQANAFLGRVEILSGRNFQSSSRKYLEQQLKNEPVECVMDVIDRIEYEAAQLPTPILFMKMVRDYASKFREAEARKNRQAHKVTAVFPKNSELESEHAKRACCLARDALSGMDRKEVIERMISLDNDYPQAGWGEAVCDLKHFFDDIDKRNSETERLEDL